MVNVLEFNSAIRVAMLL